MASSLAARLHAIAVPDEAEQTFFLVVLWLEDRAREGNVTPTLDTSEDYLNFEGATILRHYAYLKERFSSPSNNVRLEKTALDDGERIHFFY